MILQWPRASTFAVRSAFRRGTWIPPWEEPCSVFAFMTHRYTWLRDEFTSGACDFNAVADGLASGGAEWMLDGSTLSIDKARAMFASIWCW